MFKHFHNLSLFRLPDNSLHCQAHSPVDSRLCHSQVCVTRLFFPGLSKKTSTQQEDIAASEQQAGHMHTETKAPNVF